MNDQRCIREFKDLARRLGITIRYTTEGPTGLCMLRGERVFFLERNLDSRAQIRAFARDFRTLDLEGYFIVPAIRDLLGGDDDETDGGWDDDA